MALPLRERRWSVKVTRGGNWEKCHNPNGCLRLLRARWVPYRVSSALSTYLCPRLVPLELLMAAGKP